MDIETSHTQSPPAPAAVYLVGAGPGDPGMLTLRGAECLARADVVLYDYLVNPRVLRHAPPRAERICLGRHGQGRLWTQDEIQREMVRRAEAGQTVVRLKGGDPAIFARGAEEALYLREHGIPFEIVPGVTAALAAGSCAGIPVTHREMASAVALVTGQETDEKGEEAIDYRSLAKFPGTLVMYMGVTTAKTWADALLAAGKPPETPVAIIRRVSWPDQLLVRCTLAEVAERLTPYKKIPPPVIVIIGEVAALEAQLDWFRRRPLFGKSIVVTRPQSQADDLARRFEELGAEAIEQPAIAIGPPDDYAPLDEAIARLAEYRWLVFSSANGVRFFLERLLAIGFDLRALGQLRIACIGPGTARELAKWHLTADLIPDTYRAEELAAALAPLVEGEAVLLARASRGREVLREQLEEVASRVDQVVAYTNGDVTACDADLLERMQSGGIDWVTATSSAIARSLAQMFGEALRKTKIASISPVTSQTLRELGYEPACEAEEYTMEGLVDAIRRAVGR